MASSSAQTNHQLYLAKLVLGDLKSKVSEQQLDENLLLDAWGQPVLWHLHATIGHLIVELATLAKQDAVLMREAVLNGDEDTVDSLPAELRELANLVRHGWLKSMLAGERDSAIKKSVGTVNPLALQSVSTSHYVLQDLQHWFKSLDELVDRFRETTLEN